MVIYEFCVTKMQGELEMLYHKFLTAVYNISLIIYLFTYFITLFIFNRFAKRIIFFCFTLYLALRLAH